LTCDSFPDPSPPPVKEPLGLPNLFFLVRDCGLSTIEFESCGVIIKASMVNVRAEKDRPLNSVLLQNAVLCAECDVVSDSPHDHCLVCGSRSLFNISRLLGGRLPNERAMLIENASRPFTPPKRMLKFPRNPRAFNSRGRTKEQTGAAQLRMFG
jgi:hypothetical protein